MNDLEKPDQRAIFEIGTRSCRIGFAGEDKPRFIFPTIVGTLKIIINDSLSNHQKEFYIGEEALEIQEKVNLSYPIQFGHIVDWLAIEKIITYSFDKLEVKSFNTPVLFIVPMHSDLLQDEKLTKLMFEHFLVPALYFSNRELLSLYGSIGKSFFKNKDSYNLREVFHSQKATGIVINIDYERIYIVPIYLAYVITHAVKILDYGSRDIAIYFKNLIERQRYYINYPEQLDFLYKIVNKHCYLKANRNDNIIVSSKKRVKLENGTYIEVGEELFQAPEILFDPTLIGIPEISIDWGISFSIYNTDPDIIEKLYGNIIITGECSMMPGFRERLSKELEDKFEQLLEKPELNEALIKKYMDSAIEIIKDSSTDVMKSKNYNIKVNSISDFNLAWLGGSYIASVKAFEKLWVSKSEYVEKGVRLVRSLIERQEKQ